MDSEESDPDYLLKVEYEELYYLILTLAHVVAPKGLKYRSTIAARAKETLTLANISYLDISRGLRGIPCGFWINGEVTGNSGMKLLGLPVQDVLNLTLSVSEEDTTPSVESLLFLMICHQYPKVDDVLTIRKCLSLLGSVVQFRIQDRNRDIFGPDIFSLSSLLLTTDFHLFSFKKESSSVEDYILRSLIIIASLPIMLERITGTFNENSNASFSERVAKCFHIQDEKFIRLFLWLHCDHGGGNASSFVSQVVGSTNASPSAALVGALMALSGPRHGHASIDAYNWMIALRCELIASGWNQQSLPERSIIEDFGIRTLQNGVIPGFGHAALRIVDPRVKIFMNYAIEKYPQHPNVLLAQQVLDVIPGILATYSKATCVYPNVDSVTGILLDMMGLEEPQHILLLFSISRSLGILTEYIWERVCRFPLIRPHSLAVGQLNISHDVNPTSKL